MIGRRNLKYFETRILPSRNLEKCKRPYFLSHDFFERFFHEIFLRDFLRYVLILRDFFREISSRDFIEEFLDFFKGFLGGSVQFCNLETVLQKTLFSLQNAVIVMLKSS